VALHAAAGMLVAGLVVMALAAGRQPPLSPVPESVRQARPVDSAVVIDDSRYRDNWPRFRGPGGLGVAGKGPWPIAWDGVTNKNILWKTRLPLEGKGAPVIWGGRIFLTAGNREIQRVVCINRATGQIVWNQALRRPRLLRKKREGEEDAANEPLNVPEDTGWAAPTPVTDGQRVYVTFATSDVACFDANGRQLWARNFGKPDSVYGLATSLILYKDLVLFQLDQQFAVGEGVDLQLAQRHADVFADQLGQP